MTLADFITAFNSNATFILLEGKRIVLEPETLRIALEEMK